MKKIILLCMVVLMLGVSVGNAEIKRGFNQFEGVITINSKTYFEIGNLESLTFRKILVSAKPVFLILARNDTFENYILANYPVDIKINDNYSSKLQIGKHETFSPIYGKILTNLNVEVPQDVVENLKIANRVALQFTLNNGSTFVYVLTNDVLGEWKEVIATEK